MKYIKKFEKIRNPQKGDFAIMDITEYQRKFYTNDVLDIFDNCVGEIKDIDSNQNGEMIYGIKYNFLENHDFDFKRLYYCNEDEIEYFSNNKLDCELKLAQKRYNL